MKQHQILIFEERQEEFLDRGRGRRSHAELAMELPGVQQLAARKREVRGAQNRVSRQQRRRRNRGLGFGHECYDVIDGQKASQPERYTGVYTLH